MRSSPPEAQGGPPPEGKSIAGLPAGILGGALTSAWAEVKSQRNKGEFAEYVNDPVGFIEDVLGCKLWGAEDSPTGRPGQKEIAQAFADHDDVAWGTCHGAGKTWLLARLCLWFWLTRPESIVLSTAPKHEQVKNLLWREIREAHANSHKPLPGDVQVQKAEMPGHPRWYMVGFATDTPKGQDAAVTAQGVHATGGLFFVADEASGVPDGVFNTARGYRTGGNAKRAYIGNQNNRQGQFFAALHNETSNFQKFQTSALDVPEFIGGHRLMAPEWVTDMQAECGKDYENNPMYQVQVLGIPPTSDTHSLIPLTLLEENAELHPQSMGRTIGVDIARLGEDKCVAFLNDRGRLKARYEWSKARTHESAEIITQLMIRWEVSEAGAVKVDASGVGGGVVDDLHRRGIYVDAIDFGAGPQNDWERLIGRTVKFKNRRSELHYIYMKMMQQHMIAVPERYETAWQDTVSLHQIPDENGFFRIEPKDQMKKRIGRSPDDSDAILCSLSQMGGSNGLQGTGQVHRRRRRIKTRRR